MAIRNKVYVYIVAIAIIFFNIYRVNAGSLDLPLSLKIRKDLVHNTITIYLQHGATVEDSMQLFGANFRIDSLTEIDRSTWHYIYSIRCGSNCKLWYQIVLKEKKKRIHLSYVGYYQRSFKFDQLYAQDTSLRARDVMEYSDYLCDYRFNKEFFKSKSLITEYVYKGKMPDDQTKGMSSTFTLKYDRKNNIYYNSQEVLAGNYLIIEGKSKKTKSFFLKVFALEFQESEWIYLDNAWYEWNRKNNSLIKFNTW